MKAVLKEKDVEDWSEKRSKDFPIIIELRLKFNSLDDHYIFYIRFFKNRIVRKPLSRIDTNQKHVTMKIQGVLAQPL